MKRSLRGGGPRCAQPRAQMPHQLHCHWGQKHHGDPTLPFFLSPPLIHLPLSPLSLNPSDQTHCCVLIPLMTYRPISLPSI